MSTTRSDVIHAAHRLASAIEAVEGSTPRLHLQEGSPSNGRAWRIFRQDPESGALSDLFYGLDRGYLGWTKGEAWAVLTALAVGIWYVQDRERS